ncbi:hypothetical protein D9615_008935 [Tricholomella constricta]|uniref:Gag-like protein n=1 Tax=Tricholomella constricta TaxID=117010 RepID=A0A8H5H0U2_9AGAR|nr:hypothetical protein D9615_008935 [Tricholomella constricta]
MALPGARGPPGSGRPSTRATSASSTTKISCKEDARKWLEDNGHTMRPDEVEAGDLKHAILSLSKTPGVPHEVTEGLRAIAFCIEDVEQTRVEEAIAAVVVKMWEEMKEEVGVVAEASVKSVKEIGEDIRRRNEERDTREAEARPSTNNTPRLYADMARPDARTTAAEAEHREVMGRGETRDKQVLIDGRGEGSNEAIAGLTEKLLIEKAKMTLDLMGIGGLDAPRGIAFVAVRKLRNGGALYEMNSTEAAAWLRGEDVKKLFVEKFGAEVELKDRAYPLLVEFVPTSLGDNAAEAVREIERANGLGEGEVTQAKWVRAPHTRTNPNQKSAHLIVSCRTKETANRAIDKGLVIEGKRVAAKKLDQEPRRCLKCQFYGKGHIAQECKQIHETCGTCAGQHRSKDCKETDMRKLCCVNCRARRWRDNHSSADRLCPVFLEAKERLKSRMPELKGGHTWGGHKQDTRRKGWGKEGWPEGNQGKGGEARRGKTKDHKEQTVINVETKRAEVVKGRNFREVDWAKFREELEQRMEGRAAEEITTAEDVDGKLDELVEALQKTIESKVPEKKQSPVSVLMRKCRQYLHMPHLHIATSLSQPSSPSPLLPSSTEKTR